MVRSQLGIGPVSPWRRSVWPCQRRSSSIASLLTAKSPAPDAVSEEVSLSKEAYKDLATNQNVIVELPNKMAAGPVGRLRRELIQNEFLQSIARGAHEPTQPAAQESESPFGHALFLFGFVFLHVFVLFCCFRLLARSV